MSLQSMNQPGLVLSLLLSILVLPASPQTWTPTTAPPANWYSIASSADGSRLAVASYGGLIYTSTNAGGAWTATRSPTGWWQSVACSADGTKLIAANVMQQDSSGTVYISHDFGANWIQAILPAYYWYGVASSADGTRLVAVGATGSFPNTNVIYTSADSGTDWNLSNSFGDLRSIACSADGTHLAATGWQGTYTSTNSGLNWNPTPTPISGFSVTMSGDGNELIVLSQVSISVSPDWGVTWTSTSMESSASLGNPLVASSVDGASLAKVGWDYYIVPAFTSTNAGAIWTESTVNFLGGTNPCSIASSADGTKLKVAVGAYGIFTWQTDPAPVLKTTLSGHNLVLSWVVPSRDFVLQVGSDLAAWSDAGVTPLLNYTNLHYEVSLPRFASRQFYRLVSQGPGG